MAKVIVSDPAGERELALDRDAVTVGRIAQGNDVVIDVPEASRQHCRIAREGEAWFVEDLESRNGTRVNGRKVTKFELQDGDEIQVGSATLRFLESEVGGAEDEISLEDDVELEISLGDEAWLRFLNTDREGEKIELSGRVTVGRKSSNTIALREHGVSGSHAELLRDAAGWLVRDLGSTNGVVVDGERVEEARLEAGTSVRIGAVHFVVGIDGSEGDGSLAESLAAASAPDLGEEVFSLHDRDVGRRQLPQLLAFLVVVAAVGGGIWWWLGQGEGDESGRVAARSIPGNLLAAGTGFEVRDDVEELMTTESDSIDWEEREGEAASGARALRVEFRGGEGLQDLTVARPIENLTGADQIDFGGWFDTGALSGAAGVSLLWRDASGQVFDRTFLAAGESGDFVEVIGTARVPGGARGALFAVTGVDASGRLSVDDLFARRRAGAERVSLEVHGFDAMLDPDGELTLSRDGIELISDLGLVREESSGERVRLAALAPRFLGAAVERSEASVSVSGRVLLAEGGSGQVRTAARRGDEGLVVELTAEEVPGALVSLGIDPEEGLATVAEGSARRHGEDFRREAVTAVVVGSGARAAQISLDPPATVELRTDRGRSRLVLPLAAGGSLKLSIQLDFSAEGQEVTALFEAAQRLDLVEKRHGEAMAAYLDVANRFPFRQDLAQRALSRHDQLRREGEERARELEARAADIAFFRTFVYDYDDFVAEASALSDRFEGSAVAERVDAIVAELASAWSASRDRGIEERARRHLMRGRDLMVPGEALPGLARGFFRSVVALAPESEMAVEARAELDKIEALLGR